MKEMNQDVCRECNGFGMIRVIFEDKNELCECFYCDGKGGIKMKSKEKKNVKVITNKDEVIWVSNVTHKLIQIDENQQPINITFYNHNEIVAWFNLNQIKGWVVE